MYAIVTDGESWWIQGHEGRVNEELFASLDEAAQEAFAMFARGEDVDIGSYYVDSGDGCGVDWTDPRPIED